jgi:hypothetical protein
VPVFGLHREEGNIAKKEELAAIVAEWETAQASAQRSSIALVRHHGVEIRRRRPNRSPH